MWECYLGGVAASAASTSAAAATRPGGPPGLRERKKQQTRAALQDAALRLFSEKGYDNTTVEEIADAAGVSYRTFFRYFASKEEVLEADFTDLYDRVSAALSARGATPLFETLMQVGVEMATEFEARSEFVIGRDRLVLATPVLAARVLLLQAGLHARVYDLVAGELAVEGEDEVQVRLLMGAVHGVFDAAVAIWMESAGERSLVALFEDAIGRLDPVVRPLFDRLEQGEVHRPGT